jgi:hypothetical protein
VLRVCSAELVAGETIAIMTVRERFERKDSFSTCSVRGREVVLDIPVRGRALV